MEPAIWGKVQEILADPVTVLQELQHRSHSTVDDSEIERVEEHLEDLDRREKRLVRLYSLTTVDADTIEAELTTLGREKDAVKRQLEALRPAGTDSLSAYDPGNLEQICSGVAGWLDKAGDSDRNLALEALEVEVTATKESATVHGVIPTEPPVFINDEHTSRCLFSGDKLSALGSLSF